MNRHLGESQLVLSLSSPDHVQQSHGMLSVRQSTGPLSQQHPVPVTEEDMLPSSCLGGRGYTNEKCCRDAGALFPCKFKGWYSQINK